jgi:hypothetical protein
LFANAYITDFAEPKIAKRSGDSAPLRIQNTFFQGYIHFGLHQFAF